MELSIYKSHLLDENEVHEFFESRKINGSENYDNLAVRILQLKEKGISDWEQLYAMLINKSSQEDILKTLNLQKDNGLASLLSACESVLPDYRVEYLKREVRRFPLGAKKPLKIKSFKLGIKSGSFQEYAQNFEVTNKLNEIKMFNSSSFILPGSLNHVKSLNSIRDQGDRGSCTAFAVTAANEFSFFKKTNKYYDFSEQYLFHETKKIENDLECGSWITSAMQTVSYKGQCMESEWSYNPLFPCVQPYGKPSNADSGASHFKNTFLILYRNNLQRIKEVITSGRIIPFSIPVFDSWYQNSETVRSGRINMPSENENETGGHAMVIVGYNDVLSEEYPGGGYFIIRNSWGTMWGEQNYYGAGYGTIPYQYILDYAWEIYTF